jgi:hypothetical protein
MEFNTLKTLLQRECTKGALKPYVSRFLRDADKINETDKDAVEIRGVGSRSIVVSQTRTYIVTIHLFEDGIIRDAIRDTRGYSIAQDDDNPDESDTLYDDFIVDLINLFRGLEIPDIDDSSNCDCRNPRA